MWGVAVDFLLHNLPLHIAVAALLWGGATWLLWRWSGTHGAERERYRYTAKRSILLGLLLALALLTYQTYGTRYPGFTDKEIGVIVTPLVGETEKDNFEGARFARAVMDDIERHAREMMLSNLKCLYVRETVETTEDAETLMRLRNARVVVWGVASCIGDEVEFRPRVTSALAPATWPRIRVSGRNAAKFQAAVSGLREDIVEGIRLPKARAAAYGRAAESVGRRSVASAARSDVQVLLSADSRDAAVGDTLTYTMAAVNVGHESVSNTSVTGQVPRGTRYVPGSITLDGVPCTDAADGDPAEVHLVARQIRVKLGKLEPQHARFVRYKVLAEP